VEWLSGKWSKPFNQGIDTHLVIAAPLWSLAALFLILPLAWIAAIAAVIVTGVACARAGA